ncbi:MAG: hypothetical protein U0353_07070 [Sandaracinus sp.]
MHLGSCPSRDHSAARIASSIALVLAGCSGGASLHAGASTASPAAPAPRVVWLDDIDEERLVMVEADDACDARPEREDDVRSVRVIEEHALDGPDVVPMRRSPCRLRRVARLRLEVTQIADAETSVCRVTATELASEDETCGATWVVDDADASVSVPPELEAEWPFEGVNTVQLDDLVVRDRRGPPYDEICPGDVTLEVLRADGSIVGTWPGQSVFDVHGIVAVRGHRWLVIDRDVVPLDGGAPGHVEGARLVDWGANPCL